MGKDRRKLPEIPKFEQYSKVLPGDERIHESVLVKKGELLETPPDGTVTTLYDLLKRAVLISENGEFVGERKKDGNYSWLRYEQVESNSQKIGSALLRMGIRAGESTRIGVAGINCPEYLTTTFALVSYSIVFVPLYHNYKLDILKAVVNSCELEVIFFDTLDRAQPFLDSHQEMPSLKKIIVFKTSTENIPNGPQKDSDIELYEWSYLLKLGEAYLTPVTPPSPTSTYIICHTRQPKGVKLTHRALLAAMSGLYVQWCVPPHKFVFDKHDTYQSFLSPAHIYEQIMQFFITYIGGRIGIYGGDINRIVDDMKALRPTIASFVPRLLNKLYESINANARQGGFLKRFLFKTALKAKLKQLTKGQMRYDTIWDKIVFKKIHAMFGGQLRLITTGGAPLTTQVMNFSRVIYGCPLFEGYGQTECSAAGALSLPFDTQAGHVGGPATWAQIKLVDVPELKYFGVEDRGEVCFRGAGVMTGYYNNEEATAEAIDEQGWLHTGDIGMWLPNGSLRIIDRKKHFFKLAQGDYVSPEQIENVYLQHPIIFVDGWTTKSFLVAILVANMIELRALLAKQTDQQLKYVGEYTSNEEILANKNVRTLVIGELRIFGASKGLSSLEQIKNAYLTNEEFSAEAGLLTPTLKIRRHQMRQKYENEIEKLYDEE